MQLLCQLRCVSQGRRVSCLGSYSRFISLTILLYSPRYTLGCSLGAGFTGLIVILALGLHFKLSAENKKRDRIHGPVDPEEHIDVSALGDQNPKFRYLT